MTADRPPYPWEAADAIAAHFDRTSYESDLERLHAAVADAALPMAAREQLIADAVRRMSSRAINAMDGATYDRLESVLAARAKRDLDRVRAEIADAQKTLNDRDRYLEIASGWAQGCEMEMGLLERSVLRATVALTEPVLVAAVAILTADVEHAAMTSQLAAYARACTPRTQAVVHALGHRNEVGYLAVRVVELATLSSTGAA